MNKAIFSILLLFTACTQPEKSAKKWVEEAKCIDSVKIVSPHRWADIETFKIKGFTLQQVKKLYGDYNYTVYENVKIYGPEDIPDSDFSRYFKESDYPVVISVYDWFRHPKISKMYPKVNNIWDLSNYDGYLGMCMRVYFVEYEGKLIAFDAFQNDCGRLYFLE